MDSDRKLLLLLCCYTRKGWGVGILIGLIVGTADEEAGVLDPFDAMQHGVARDAA